MDQLDRIYRTLVRTIRTSFPQYLTQPFEVAELYQTILPYRHHRRSLGFDTNQDYEVALLELLAGERGYLLVEERMRDALRRELATPNPDPAVFRQYAGSQISLAHEPLRQVEAVLDSEAPTTESDRITGSIPSPTGEPAIRRASGAASEAGASTTRASMNRPPAPAAPPRPSAPSASAAPRSGSGSAPAVDGASASASAERGVVAGPGDGCRFCGGALPAGRRLVFCPHCGQDLTVQHCLACGTELELGWRFCISCGRSVAAG